MPGSSFLAKSINLLIVIFASAASAAPGSTIQPAAPLPFERVHVRVELSQCLVDVLASTVTYRGGRIRVTLQPNILAFCIPEAPTEPFDFQLGAFPVGTYDVEIEHVPLANQPPERLTFTVNPLMTVAIVPLPTRPVADYGGLWLVPAEPGWGLALQQSLIGGMLFGELFVYDAQREPRWYTLQSGAWPRPTLWEGKLIRSNGPPWSAQPYDTGSVTSAEAGTVSVDFAVQPDAPGTAVLRYALGGVTIVKNISRTR